MCLCRCVCVYVCMCVYMYVCMYVCMYVRLFVCLFVCIYLCSYVCKYVSTMQAVDIVEDKRLAEDKIMFLAASFNFTSECKWVLCPARFTNTYKSQDNHSSSYVQGQPSIIVTLYFIHYIRNINFTFLEIVPFIPGIYIFFTFHWCVI